MMPAPELAKLREFDRILSLVGPQKSSQTDYLN
jgi:hypothetical protein